MFPYSSGAGYAALGLTGNPFVAESRPGVEAHLWISRPGLPEPPVPGGRRLVQVIGPKGAGKTSALLHWRDQVPGPYHYVAMGWRRWAVPPVGDIVYWDEVDRLAGPARIAGFARAAAARATVVTGTHADLSRLARACGLRVLTHEYSMLTPQQLQEWATRRIGGAALAGAQPQLVLDDETARQVCDRAGPSLRSAGVELHKWAARQAELAAPPSHP